MRKLKVVVVIIALMIGLFVIGPVVSAEEVTTVETTVSEEVLPDVIEGNAIDAVVPTAQLTAQIIQGVVTVIGLIVIFKQRIEVAVAKKREADAKGELSVEVAERQMVLKSIGTIMSVLNMISQNSKLPTTDKLSIAEMISSDQSAMTELADTIAEISGLNKTDISAILSSFGDLAEVGVNIATAVKTGDVGAIAKAMSNSDTVEGD